MVSQYHQAIVRAAKNEKTENFTVKLRERMWKAEGLFAEAKQNHCLRRAKYRGLEKVQIQAYMIAMVQNLKRLAGHRFFDLLEQMLLEIISVKIENDFIFSS